MNPIKGQNLRVMVGGKCIAMATSCTLHVNISLQDSSSKDSTGSFQEQDPTGLAWDVQTQSLVTMEDNGVNGELPNDLLSLIINMTEVTLTFDQTNGTNNRTAVNAPIKRSGKAYLTDFSLTAQNRQNSQLQCQFTGNGPLA